MADASDKLTMYEFARCPFCIKVRRALKRKGVDYESVIVKKGSETAKMIEERMGTFMLPTINHGDVWMQESEDILKYVNEIWPDESRPSFVERVWNSVFSPRFYGGKRPHQS